MSKLKPEEILDQLSKSVEKALGNDSSDDADSKAKDNALAKSINNLDAKMNGIMDFISKNVKVEKPKSVEEIVSEKIDELAKSLKGDNKDGDSKEDDKEIGAMTRKDLNEMVTKSVSEVIKDVVKKDDPDGEISEEEAVGELVAALAKSAGVENYEPDEIKKPKKKKAVSKSNDSEDDDIDGEEVTENGRVLSKSEKKNRSELDGFIAKALMQKHSEVRSDDED